MKHTVETRIPRCKLTHFTIMQDNMFAEFMKQLIEGRIVLHHREMDFDYIILEVRTSEDPLDFTTKVEMDIEVVRGEYKPTEVYEVFETIECKEFRGEECVKESIYECNIQKIGRETLDTK